MSHFFTSALMAASLIVASVGTSSANDDLKTAIFAGGCFWCVESDFDHVNGVVETLSGYSGGTTTENVTYKNHSAAKHREVVKITYDSSKVTYDQLLDVFWRSVDPTDGGGQFCDRGHSYTTAIYTLDEDQAKLAKASKAKLEADKVLSDPIQTEIAPAMPFFAAEDYHQDYYNKNPIRYKYYRYACARDERIERVWGEQAHKGIMKQRRRSQAFPDDRLVCLRQAYHACRQAFCLGQAYLVARDEHIERVCGEQAHKGIMK